MSTPDKLVIFDYSGTLSLEAPRFARPGHLTQALRESGLADLGITTPEIFWEQIVDPTWIEGSTTLAGYKRVLAGRVAAIRPVTGIPQPEIEAAANRFVNRYLEQSRIDPLWHPLLTRLGKDENTLTVIATDHYAEATETIIGFLKAWGITAAKAGERNETRFSPLFCIANSSELGFWKEDRRFWEILRMRLSPKDFRKVLLIDDFGLNEAIGDRYGDSLKVTMRQEKTLASIQTVFQTRVEIIPFRLAGETGDEEAARSRTIANASDRICRFLEPYWLGDPCLPDAHGGAGSLPIKRQGESDGP